MKPVTIQHIVILKSNATDEQIEKLKDLTGSDKIKHNGHITVKTEFVNYKEYIRQKVSEIFSIPLHLIYLSYSEK